MITSASRAQLWLTVLACLVARLALPGAEPLSMAWAAAALLTGIFCQRLISGERYYWAGAPAPHSDAPAERIFLFGDFIETEVELAREKSYLSTAASSQRTYFLAGGVAAIVLVSFTFLRMNHQVSFRFPDALMLVCALSLLPAMTPRHFLAPAFIASTAVLLDWALAPAGAGAWHFLTIFLAAACLVAHEWINAERSTPKGPSFKDPVLWRGLLRETSHIIVPLLLIGTLVSLAFPRSETETRVVHRMIHQSAALLASKLTPAAPPATTAVSPPTASASGAASAPSAETLPSVPAVPVPASGTTTSQARTGSPTAPSAEEVARLLNALQWPTPSSEEINQALTWAKDVQVSPSQREALEQAVSRVPAGPRAQALAESLRGRSPTEADLEALEKLMQKGQLSPADTAALSRSFSDSLHQTQARAPSSGPDLIEQIDAGKELGNAAPGREIDLEALRERIQLLAANTQPDRQTPPAREAGAPPTLARSHGSESTNASIPMPMASIAASLPVAPLASAKGVPAATASASPAASTTKGATSSSATPPPAPAPAQNPALSRNWERILRVLLFIVLSCAVLYFLAKLGKQVQAPDQDGNAKESRKRRKALVRDIAKLERARLSAAEEIERRYALFLEIMAATGNPREEWLPATDFYRASSHKFRSLAGEIRDVNDTFCDWRYGNRLPGDGGLARFRSAFTRIAQWFGATG